MLILDKIKPYLKHEYMELTLKTCLLLMVLTQNLLSNGLFEDIRYDAKGHFYLQNHHGRSIFITPDGVGFYPIGINHLNVPFNKGVNGKSKDEIKKNITRHLQDWGFNCGGYGMSSQLISDGFYFIGSINLVRQGFYHLNHAQFPDLFDEAFERQLESTFRRTAKWTYKPKQLIGMVWSDLPAWNIEKSRMLRQTDWVSRIRELKETAPGKKVYLDFLKNSYKNRLDELNQYYDLQLDHFDKLSNVNFSNLYLGHPRIIEDDQLFMEIIARKYYELGAKYHKKYFPNIPLLGDRYLLGDHPDAILKIASEVVDAISIQVGDGFGESMPASYPWPQQTIDHIQKVTGKPILIADHQISFSTDKYDKTTFSQAGDEGSASRETENFLNSTFSNKQVCGYFRCTYLTQNEPHGRGIKQGLVDFMQKPYPLITESYSKLNFKISEYLKVQDP